MLHRRLCPEAVQGRQYRQDTEKGIADPVASGIVQNAQQPNFSVYKQLKDSLEPDASQLGHPLELAFGSEVLDHMMAGIEGAAIAMTYIMWELSHNPEWQIRLREEVLTADQGLVLASSPEKQEPLPSPRFLDSLSLLEAILKETLRRWTPGPGAQSRLSPISGCTLVERFVPEGARVGASACVLHRNEVVLSEPEIWRPERWLVETEDCKAMKR